MKTFISDWKNIGLISCGLIILVLLGLLIFRSGDAGAVLVEVNGKNKYTITKEQVYKELVKSQGDKLVTRLVNQYVLEDYASDKGVSVSPAEKDQFINQQRLIMEMQGQSLESLLKSQNMTMEDVYNQITPMLLQIKLVVPNSEIEARLAKIVKEGKPPFTLPTHYRYRELIFSTAEEAKAAADAIKKDPQQFDLMAAGAINGQSAKEAKLFIPGMDEAITGKPSKDPGLKKVLAGLKINQVSSPLTLPMKGVENFRRVIQLTEILPPVKPTLENCGMTIGQELMMSDPKYGAEIRKIEGEALNNVELKFLDFKAVSDAFGEKKRTLAPALSPSMDPSSSPAPASPKLPSAPAPPAPPQGKQ